MSDLHTILGQVLELYNGDKRKFIQFCVDWSHSRKDMAKVLGVSDETIRKFIIQEEIKRRA